ncbi:MAG: EAL domain-containing protein [Thermoanaerobaculales bacterium]|jgi:diguanylate cyclase (GGDEF)-like protein|nr:EAL domain-containing protein [Thermoanaerobaculales bacterium]
MGFGRFSVSPMTAVTTVLFVGLSLSVYLGVRTATTEIDRVDEHFRRNAKDHASAIENGIEAHLETVRVLGDFLSVHGEVDRSEFSSFARTLTERYDAIQALEWVPKVTSDQRPALLERIRREIPDFDFRTIDPDGILRPSPTREVTYPVLYVEPMTGNEAALGFDPVNQPDRDRAIRRAVTTRRLAVSAPIRLVQDPNGRQSVLSFVPVVSSGSASPAASAISIEVIGLAEGVFIVGDLFEHALAMLEPAGQDMELWDVTATAALLHEHISRRAGTGSDRALTIDGRQIHRTRFDVGGRVWEVVVRPHAGFYFYDLRDAVLLSTTVVVLTVVLALFSGFVVRREQMIREVVKERTRQLSYQATHDTLTGLANRSEFELRLAEAMQRCRDTGETMSLCYLDLDQFKVVNDTSGHAAGDELLRNLGPLLAAGIREGDVLARLGGDEFGVLFRKCDVDVARRLAERMLDRIASYRFAWKNRIFSVGASCGLVRLDAHTESEASALSRADAACYIAKEKGRGRVHVFASGDRESDHFRLEIEWLSELRLAMKEDRLELWQQPLWSTDRLGGTPAGREILVRFRKPTGELVPPGSFLPAAERFQLMPELDRWIVEHAIGDLVELGPTDGAGFWSINLSGQTLGDDGFGDFAQSVLRSSGVDVQRVCFEITETALVTNLAQARQLIGRLRALGCRFALDDFGSGMSSFAYLKNLPVDYLKIDGSFVRGLVEDPMDQEIVRAIHRVSAHAGIRTVAESVETQDVLDLLTGMRIDMVQGYLVGRPEPLRAPEAVRSRLVSA